MRVMSGALDHLRLPADLTGDPLRFSRRIGEVGIARAEQDQGWHMNAAEPGG